MPLTIKDFSMLEIQKMRLELVKDKIRDEKRINNILISEIKRLNTIIALKKAEEKS